MPSPCLNISIERVLVELRNKQKKKNAYLFVPYKFLIVMNLVEFKMNFFLFFVYFSSHLKCLAMILRIPFNRGLFKYHFYVPYTRIHILLLFGFPFHLSSPRTKSSLLPHCIVLSFAYFLYKKEFFLLIS